MIPPPLTPEYIKIPNTTPALDSFSGATIIVEPEKNSKDFRKTFA